MPEIIKEQRYANDRPLQQEGVKIEFLTMRLVKNQKDLEP